MQSETGRIPEAKQNSPPLRRREENGIVNHVRCRFAALQSYHLAAWHLASRLVAFCLVVFTLASSAADWPGEKSEWFEFARYDFEVDGRACIVVCPETAEEGTPWIWRARFFGHEPQTDLALLQRGFHVVYMDVGNLFGNPQAVKNWDSFHEYLTDEHGFSEKAVLEGMSRGGLIVYNWAAKNPKKVACIYADAPVCDFKSWPGGRGEGKGSPKDWTRCLEVYGLSEEQALAYKHNPIDNLEPLVKAGVPLMHVCGDADGVVPIEENTRVLESRYRAMGGAITVIAKSGIGHHPHSLKDPTLIVDFILRHTLGTGDWFVLRGELNRSRTRFERQKKGRVAFLGGSITHNPGWRDKTAAYLQERFPETDFDFVNAGIPSMGSTPGAFRLTRDVFSRGQVDLLFVEAAVNDAGNGRTAVEQIRGMEGIVRHARTLQPEIDIVMMHFVDPSKMEMFRVGTVPPVIANHERVAEQYDIPSLNLALEVTERIEAGEFTWKDDFKDLHPSPFGQQLYFESIKRLLETAWAAPINDANPLQPHRFPEQPLDEFSYAHARLVDIGEAKLGEGWERVERWKPEDRAGTRKGFVNVPMLVSSQPGASVSMTFEGRAVGILVAAGPDAGTVEYTIDGKRYEAVDLFTRWSGGLHLPWAYILASDLETGEHVLTLRVGEAKHSDSLGHAVRVAYWLVN